MVYQKEGMVYVFAVKTTDMRGKPGSDRMIKGLHTRIIAEDLREAKRKLQRMYRGKDIEFMNLIDSYPVYNPYG